MKRFRVNEYGKDVWIMLWDDTVEDYCVAEESADYVQHVDYFLALLNTISEIDDDIDLVLNVTEESTLMTLYLKDGQLPFAEEIKSKLLEKFPDDIEQIGIVGNELNIMDFLFEHNG